MRIYVGQTRARWLTAELAALGWGECTNRGELPPRRSPWFFDNGAFSDWKAEKEWDQDAYEKDLAELKQHHLVRPDFAVVPDVVAGGAASLERSRQWLPRVRLLAPAYIAVQNGMVIEPKTAEGFDGIFVGGDDDFKRTTAFDWVRLARRLGVPCHLGRCGSGKKVRWAKDIGADSIDSSLPLWSKDNLRVFRGAVDEDQLTMLPRDLELSDEYESMRADYEHHCRRLHAISQRIFRETGVKADSTRRLK